MCVYEGRARCHVLIAAVYVCTCVCVFSAQKMCVCVCVCVCINIPCVVNEHVLVQVYSDLIAGLHFITQTLARAFIRVDLCLCVYVCVCVRVCV